MRWVRAGAATVEAHRLRGVREIGFKDALEALGDEPRRHMGTAAPMNQDGDGRFTRTEGSGGGGDNL